MRKSIVKKLREEFEDSPLYYELKGGDKLRSSSAYKKVWRQWKRYYKEHGNE